MAATKAIDIRTEIPGPRSREILERKERVVAEPLSIYADTFDWTQFSSNHRLAALRTVRGTPPHTTG